MALNPQTPGVYVQEISTLPSSVVAVPTAIPVFIGYTEKAEINGVPVTDFPTSPTNPIRITSFLDFQTIFGGPNSEAFNVTLTGPDVDITTSLNESTGTDFRLYYHMQMFYANGGGTCYVIAVGNYSGTIDGDDLKDAIALAEQVGEITMVVVPEAISTGVNNSKQRAIYDEMLAHCEKMQDRFSILDVKSNGISIADDAEKFRNLNVSSNNLSYGAAYYPPFTATLSFSFEDTGVTIDASNPNLPASIQLYNTKTLDFLTVGEQTTSSIDFTSYSFPGAATDTLTINGEVFDLSVPTSLADLYNLIIANSVINASLTVTAIPNTTSPTSIDLTTITAGTSINISTSDGTIPISDISISPNVPSNTGISPNLGLYNKIIVALKASPVELYPSATMAGVYSAVDNDRGVWKAPANVGLASVSSLKILIKDSDQEGLNVDATSGKSIDAIRNFSGRGILVWGARTLDGNSNEWRYVNVRRLFLFVEDSCKQASEFVVFEPNTKNTWTRVKSMISNFLTNLWRDGALAGDKPEQAFFVKVGLNETMTAQDILEGRLIVQIGMAAVRPAEFIILQFEHKLQEA